MAGDSGSVSLQTRAGWCQGATRALRHGWTGAWHTHRAFPARALQEIEAAIAQSEAQHGAQIRFALEPSLSARALWRRQSARERALELFAAGRVWDTEDNTGILIYLLWADRAVEIVVDRGAARGVPAQVWDEACAQIVTGCREGRALAGVLAALAHLTPRLAQSLPRDTRRALPNELPDAPWSVRSR